MPCVYLPGPAPAVTVANNYEVFSLSTDYPILHTLLPIRIYGFTLSISPIDKSIVLFPYHTYFTIHFLPLLLLGMGEWGEGLYSYFTISLKKILYLIKYVIFNLGISFIKQPTSMSTLVTLHSI